MGLDMYLTKKTYVKNWDHMKPEQLTNITVEGGRGANIQTERISEIVESVGYWRKANAIHIWFVENCQNGVDECQESYVGRDNLQELLRTVNEVLDNVKMGKGDVHTGTTYQAGTRTENYEEGKIVLNPDVCDELLPTSSGFFFGSTDYDEWYIKDLELTKQICEDALKEDDGGDFYYQSSW